MPKCWFENLFRTNIPEQTMFFPEHYLLVDLIIIVIRRRDLVIVA